MKERRLTARIEAPFPARLKTLDRAGHLFTEDAVLDNLSKGGLHMRLLRNIPQGASVTVAVRLSVERSTAPALRLAARGTIVRTEARPDGSWGVGIEFMRTRIL